MAINLQSISLAQLKALCKEKKIIGYSKLSKDALIKKIQDSGVTIDDAAVAQVSNIRAPPKKAKAVKTDAAPLQEPHLPQTPAVAPLSLTGPAAESAQTTSPSQNKSTIASPVPIPSLQTTLLAARATEPLPESTSPSATIRSTQAKQISPASSKKRSGSPSADTVTKKSKTSSATNAQVSCSSFHTSSIVSPSIVTALPSQISQPLEQQAPFSSVTRQFMLPPSILSLPKPAPLLLQSTAVPDRIAISNDLVVTSKQPTKRFRPLALKRTIIDMNPAPQRLQPESPVANISISENSLASRYLDLPEPTSSISLVQISRPPRITDRKRVPRLSLALSQVRTEDLPVVSLVSRLWRYSGYLSALHRLRHAFPGSRTEHILVSHNQNTTNFWPYLRKREYEATAAKLAYEASLLHDLFHPAPPISSILWTNPDSTSQINVVLRFLLSAVFVSFSVGNNAASLFSGLIVDAKETAQPEIWQLAIRHGDSLNTLYILAATGEPLGGPEQISSARDVDSDNNGCGVHVRADWAAFISCHREVLASTSLRDRIRWQNHEEYDHGLSTLWLKRVEREGVVGLYKKVVAERYVFACVVGNSLSGKWMSLTELEQDFAGNVASGPENERKVKKKAVTLYLPGHHLVESVHFATSKGIPFHPAIASVQTLHREYFILKDNGMQVGSEEEGVAEVWQRLLGCDTRGVPSF
ncbi:hypothetical protein DL96DRAFT_1611180 [Flagelloscypha sp. PMI_526]|nr:hypothetical protein DL96DRAFT_1611180 [Flagelloscypha sp. PMI_526]